MTTGVFPRSNSGRPHWTHATRSNDARARGHITKRAQHRRRRDRVAELSAEGVPPPAIARIMTLSDSTVYALLREIKELTQ